MKEVKIPKLDNNSEVALVSWAVKNRDHIKKGQTLLTAETIKTVEEIKAESDGIIYILSKYEKEAPFNIPIALICEDESEFLELNKKEEKNE